MKKKILLPITALFLILFIACERQLDFDFSKEKPLIVMNGIIQPDEAIEVYISKSYSILDTSSYAMHLKDASVELHINDKFVEKLKLISIDSLSSPKRGRSTFRSEAHAKIGDRVRIVATAPGLETAWAETVIPEPPTIGKVDTASFLLMTQSDVNIYGGYGSYQSYYEGITYEPFYRMLRLNIDVERAKNSNSQYFLLRLWVNIPSNLEGYDFFPTPLFLDTKDDPIFANDPKNSIFDTLFEKNYSFPGSAYFSDKAFKNNNYTLNVSTFGYYYSDIKTVKGEDGVSKYVSHEVKNLPIEIKVYSVSPDLYSYMKERESGIYETDGLSYITEPKVTDTNVHNGIGYVGAMSYAHKQIATPVFNGKEDEIPR